MNNTRTVHDINRKSIRTTQEQYRISTGYIFNTDINGALKHTKKRFTDLFQEGHLNSFSHITIRSEYKFALSEQKIATYKNISAAKCNNTRRGTLPPLYFVLSYSQTKNNTEVLYHE